MEDKNREDDLIIELTDLVEEVAGERGTVPIPSEEKASCQTLEVHDALLQEIKKQMPAITEEFVRPLLSQVVNDMISSTKAMLPEIVEKVIREEIEKLKKIKE